jgi:hypothetical protein
MQERQGSTDAATGDLPGVSDGMPSPGRDDRDLHARLAERDQDSRLAAITRTGVVEPTRRFMRD